MLRNGHFKHSLWLNMTTFFTLNANAKENHHFKHTLWPNMPKIVTLNSNGQKPTL